MMPCSKQSLSDCTETCAEHHYLKGYLVKKLISVAMLIAALCFINFAATGCKDTTTTPPKKDPTVAAGDKKTVKITAITTETEILKKGDTKVKVEIAEAAPETLTLTATAKDVDAKVLTGKGEIKKGEKSGEVVITTVDVPATVTEVTVAAKSAATTDADTKLKVKVK